MLPAHPRAPPAPPLREIPVAFSPRGTPVSVPEHVARTRRRSQRRRAIVWWGVVPGALLVAIIIIVVLISRGPLPTPNNQTATIVPGGRALTVNESTYLAFAFSLSVHEHVTGSFRANPTIQAYLLSKGQFANITPRGGPQAWVWASGNTTSATMNVGLTVGLWYLEFVNPSRSANCTVTITSAFQAKG